VCASASVVFLYNIILYTIYMATVLAVGRKNVICSCPLFDGGLSSFPFGGRIIIIIIIIIKKLFFFLFISFFSSPWFAVGGGVVPKTSRFDEGYIGFLLLYTYEQWAHCLPGPKKLTEKYLQFCQPNKYITFVLTSKYLVCRNSKDIIL